MPKREDPLLFVNPTMREAARRRIRLIEDYLAGPQGDAEAYDAAKALGMRITSFHRLARAWKETRDPGRLGIGPSATSRSSDVSSRVTDDQAAIVREAAAGLPAETFREQVVRHAGRIGAERGVAMPNPQKLRLLVDDLAPRLRRRVAPPSGVGGLMIEHIALDLGVQLPSTARPIRPVGTFLAQADDGHVLDVAIGEGPPTPRAVASVIVSALEQGIVVAGNSTGGAAIRPILIDRLPGSDWSPLIRTLGDLGFRIVGDDRMGMRRTWIQQHHGRRIAGIDLRPRLTERPPSERFWQPSDRRETALSDLEARQVILSRLATTSLRSAGPPTVASAGRRTIIETLGLLR